MPKDKTEMNLVELLRLDATVLKKLKIVPPEAVHNYAVLNAIENCCLALAELLEESRLPY